MAAVLGVAGAGLLLGPATASAAELAAVPAPAPAPTPYGGQLDAPETVGFLDDEHLLEVAMLALGSANGLAVMGVLFVNRFRGSAGSAVETRRALMARTDAGVPSGPRGRARTRR